MKNKSTITRRIVALEQAIKMEAHIRETLEKFKHYKQVNKKFTDALKENGEYHAYIIREEYSTVLTVYPNCLPYSERQEFRVMISHLMTKKELTWEKIEKTFETYRYQEWLEEERKNLENFDEEMKQLLWIKKTIDNFSFGCFSLSDIKYKIQEMICFGEKE